VLFYFNNNQISIARGDAVNMRKLVTIIAIATIMLLTACIPVDTPEAAMPPPTIEPPPTATSPEQNPEDGTPKPPDGNNTDIQNKGLDISDIPYYGNRENFALPPEHALAYAKAIENAEFNFYNTGVIFGFDIVYPVFIDVTGDGVPLLMLVEKTDETDAWNNEWAGLPMQSALLFGYSNGEIQHFPQSMAIGIMLIDGERLLSVGGVSDFGGSYDFYRVHNAAAEFVSTMKIVADWHGGTPHGEISIDGIEINPEEYWEILETIPTERLIDKWHPGNTVVTPLFEAYISQPLTREQAIQMFLDYAESG
jgi:hypothetical protein